MEVSARLKVNSAYVLRADDVCKLWELLENKVGTVKASALCADDLEREFGSSTELIGYTNFPAHRIQSLEFRARSVDRESAATVRFVQRYSPYIALSASGQEATIDSLKQYVANFCQAIKPWYSGISKIEFFYIGIVISCLAGVILGVMGGNVPAKLLSAKVAILITLAFIVLLAIIYGSMWVLNIIRAKFFPVGAFALGAEERRHQFNENVRWMVFVGFFVSLAAAVVFALMWR